MGKTEKYPRVTVLSQRTAKNGRVVSGQVGEGVILPDDPDTAYVTGQGWFGDWPVAETDIPALREAEKARVAAEKKMGEEVIRSMGDTRDAYGRLVTKLREVNPALGSTQSGYLLTKDGRYLRMPTTDEFIKSFTELQNEGKVQP